MIQKITGFTVTNSELTEDRMAMTTIEREALSVNRRVYGLTTWDKDLEKFYFMNEELEWVEVEMGGDFAVYGEATVEGDDLLKNGDIDEWIITFNRSNFPFNKFTRTPVVNLYHDEKQIFADVEVTEDQIQIIVNQETDIKYILN